MNRLLLKSFVIQGLVGLTISLAIISCAKDSQVDKIDFIIDWEPGLDYLGYYVADHEGYYRDEGVTVHFRHVNGAPLSASLIGSGKSLIGTTTADQVILANTRREASEGWSEENLEIAAVATIFGKNPIEIISLSDNPVNHLEDLKGKILGMNSASVTFRQFILLAKKAGIESEINFVDIGWGGTEHLYTGDIHALLAYTMERPVRLELMLEEQNDARSVIRLPLREVDDSMNLIGQVIAVHKPSFHSEVYQETLIKVIQASLRGWKLVIEDPPKALDIYRQKYGSIVKSTYMERSLEKTIDLLPENIEKYLIDSTDWVRARDAVAGIEGTSEIKRVPVDRFIITGLGLD